MNLNFANRILVLCRYYYFIFNKNLLNFLVFLILPVADVIIWGSTTLYFQKNLIQIPNLLYLLLSAFILWSVLWQAQQQISHQFILDIYSKSLSNILITPVKPIEIFFALILFSLGKLFLLVFVFSISAYFLFSTNFFYFGILIIPAIINLLLFGWILGIIAISFIVRFGTRCDFLTWTIGFFVWPFSCVFYSRDSLPQLLKTISFTIPSSYVFEYLRKIVVDQKFDLANIFTASLLNLVYLFIACVLFLFMMKLSKKSGNLARM